jgi:branched-chain amino acid aminotransferase
MDGITTEFYVIDNKLYRSKYINYKFDNSEYDTYEVLRYTGGVMIFLDDHLNRMKEGVMNFNVSISFPYNMAVNNLRILHENISGFQGNIKLLCRVNMEKCIFAAYGISYRYPEPEMYRTGVKIKTFQAVRPAPSVKQVQVANSIMKKLMHLKDQEFYETLLVDQNDCITEGSKSNFFLISEACLFSAPEKDILHGVTRKYVLKIAAEKNIPVYHNRIKKNDLTKYQSAFICGTSPKILPVRQVDHVHFNPHDPLLKDLMEAYNLLMEDQMRKGYSWS